MISLVSAFELPDLFDDAIFHVALEVVVGIFPCVTKAGVVLVPALGVCNPEFEFEILHEAELLVLELGDTPLERRYMSHEKADNQH